MTLAQLLSIFPQTKWGSATGLAESVVRSLCFDSRKLEQGCVFVAIRGTTADGHQFLPDAVNKGAIALIVEDVAKVPGGYTGAVVAFESTRDALNRLAARYFGEPATKMFCVGVTGTNGKTTTTHLIEDILNQRGWPTGVIGTINHHLGEHVWKTELTTPDPLSFQKRLAEFLALGAKAVTLEVSSIALHQKRIDEVPFDVAVFSNLTRDHLDYHSDMEDYFAAKVKLFDFLLARSKKPHPTAIINGDDPYGVRLIELSKGVRTWTYGSRDEHDLSFKVLSQGFEGTRFTLKTPAGQGEFLVRMPGLHNVYNASSAIGVGIAAGADLKQCANALEYFNGVKGRLESVPNKQGYHIFVDYAHSDDAIRTVLYYLNQIRRESKINNKVITVFGCGGDRDRGKRPLMMKAAQENSDLVVLTSDNPRTEDPQRILDDARAAAEPSSIGRTVFEEIDRKKGIAKAIELASPGDVILIAGKGHEDYQIIGTTKFPFSDVEAVKEILK